MAVDVSEEVDIGIAAFSLEAQVGLNFIIYATFNDPPVFGIELTAFAGIAIELSFLCIDLGLFINAELMLGGQISEQGVDLYGCGSLQLGIYYDVCELVADCFSESLRLELWWGSSTGGELDMDASLGGGSCSGNSGFNSDHSPCN